MTDIFKSADWAREAGRRRAAEEECARRNRESKPSADGFRSVWFTQEQMREILEPMERYFGGTEA
jgi:hypothetical protein